MVEGHSRRAKAPEHSSARAPSRDHPEARSSARRRLSRGQTCNQRCVRAQSMNLLCTRHRGRSTTATPSAYPRRPAALPRSQLRTRRQSCSPQTGSKWLPQISSSRFVAGQGHRYVCDHRAFTAQPTLYCLRPARECHAKLMLHRTSRERLAPGSVSAQQRSAFCSARRARLLERRGPCGRSPAHQRTWQQRPVEDQATLGWRGAQHTACRGFVAFRCGCAKAGIDPTIVPISARSV